MISWTGQQGGGQAEGGLVCLCRTRCHGGPSRVGRGGDCWRGDSRGASINEIHSFPPSLAYGGPLSTATEAEVMQFVGMSCHLANCPSHRGPRPAEDKGRQGQLVVSRDPHRKMNC